MDFLLSLFVPKKIKRHKDMSLLFAVAILIVAAYLLCIPVKIKNKDPMKAINENGYSSNDFYSFVTEYDYNNILAINPTISDGVFDCDAEATIFTLEGLDSKIYVIMDKNFTEYTNDFDAYSSYDIAKEENTFVFLFGKTFYTAYKGLDGNYEPLQGAQYSLLQVDFSTINNTTDFVKELGISLATIYCMLETSLFTVSAILMVIVIPVILVTVLWLLLRKKSEMKSFREYFNVAAISSIAPVIIFFGLGWISSQIINFYTGIFAVYYIFVVYKINTNINK